MKSASRPMLRALLAACILTPAGLWAQSSDSPAENVSSALNPNNDAARTLDTSVDRILFRLSTPQLTSAGSTIAPSSASPTQKSWECDWFKAPTVFVNNLFNNNNDQRPGGLGTFQYRLQLGADFVTYADIVAGVMYTYGFEDGEADDIFGQTLDYDKVSHHLTLYAGRSFGDWFLAGATMTFGWADIDSRIPGFGVQAGNDTFSYSPSVYAGVAHSWDKFGFSSVFAYQYEEISYDPGTNGAPVFNTSTGTFTWKTSGTWYAADWVDVSAYYKLTQIAHTNVQLALPAGESNDHNWSTIGSKATFHPAASWEVYAGVDYDLFNRNYGENVTGLLGASYRF